MKQIQRLYSKEKAKHKEEKTYVVSRNFQSPGKNSGGRGMKVVDPRMKKDMRNGKFAIRKSGGKAAPKAKGTFKQGKGGKAKKR